MNDNLAKLWNRASETGVPQRVGEIVVCDICSEDYTLRPDHGGFILGSYAYCPSCATRKLGRIIANGEAHMIRARCPSGTSFADFVRRYRGPGATISIQAL